MSDHPPKCVCDGCFAAKVTAGAMDVLASHGRAPTAGDRWLATFARQLLSEQLRLCESPAEEAFVAGLFIVDEAMASRCAQQHQLGGFRLDFAFIDERLAIEIDGHAFHDRTPDQAEHDRSRDRYLLSVGWRVTRFTAREVFRDAPACARQVLGLLEDSAA